MDPVNEVCTLNIKAVPLEKNTEKDLRRHFEKFGRVLYVRTRLGPNQDVAYVQFESHEQVHSLDSFDGVTCKDVQLYDLFFFPPPLTPAVWVSSRPSRQFRVRM